MKLKLNKKCLLNAIFFTWGMKENYQKIKGKIRNQTRIQSEKKINIYERIFSNLLVIFALGVFQFPIPWKESRILLHN